MLTLRAVNAEKYALTLMDALFTDEEMTTSCFAKGSRSTKEALDPSKTKVMEGKHYEIL